MKYGPPKTGFGFGIGGGDGRDKVDRVKAYFEANPKHSTPMAAEALQVRLCMIWSHFCPLNSGSAAASPPSPRRTHPGSLRWAAQILKNWIRTRFVNTFEVRCYV